MTARPDLHQSPNTDGSPAAPPMPELREGFLSEDDLTQLGADLTQLTQILSVQTRAHGQTHAAAAQQPLQQLLQQLAAGTWQALQIRYLYDGFEWTDTLLSMQGRIRAVRCQHPRC